ncbi:MAG: class I SAM-dependent methyltransferase [Methanospirillaceae archaeon]|nr:class I SAM-dependent methyltransferase [Methanospirillaceae archaeon]
MIQTDSNKKISPPQAGEHYRARAAAYDDRVHAILKNHETFFSTCISYVPDGPVQLLELGSGTGYATELIHAKNSAAGLTCIDHAPEMIALAKEKEALKDVSFLLQDILDPWPAKRFDCILTTLCLHHIPKNDRTKLFARVYKALTDGGVFICGDIIRPESMQEEGIYRERWVMAMQQAGMPGEEIDGITSSRREHYLDMETVHSSIQALKQAGFPLALMPYRYEISAVCIAIK